MSDVSRKDKSQGFRLTRQFTVTMAVIFTITGLLALIFGTNLTWGWLGAIGSTLLSIGLVTLVTEYFLRSIFTHELLELVELRDQVVQAGFSEATLESKTNWEELYKRSRQITLLLPDPRGWLSREWNYVLEAAAKRACDVRIYLPDDKSDLMLEFGRLTFGLEPEDYKSILSSTERKISESWSNQSRHSGSELSVYRLTDPTSYAIAGFDGSIAFILHNIGGGPGVSNLSIRFANDTNNVVQIWARNALTALEKRDYELYYENRKALNLKSGEERI